MSSDLVISQQLLEQNEDIIAAIVENLQLGRLNDCMQHYAILQANLVSLATELDNFPAEEHDPYSKLNIFPDELMRKDVLEDLRPPGYRTVPDPPIVPSCAECTARGIPSHICRMELLHVEPSGKFTATEREEFLHATQVLAARHQQFNQDAKNGKSRRQYKNWSEYEHYSLAIGWCLFSMNMEMLCQVLENRTETQIRSKISHMQKEGDWPPKKPLHELMEDRDPSYQPPPVLSKYFAAHASGIDPYSVRGQEILPTRSNESDEIDPAAATATESLLAPSLEYPDFNLLLSIAAGVSTHDLEAIPTRVPSSPTREALSLELGSEKLQQSANNRGSSGDGPEVSIITDVGIENSDLTGINERLESAFSAVKQANDASCSAPVRASQYNGTGSGTANGSGVGNRHVHWGATTESIIPSHEVTDITNDGNRGSSKGQMSLPSLRDPGVANYLPPPPSGAPSFLRDPLREIIHGNPQDPHSEAHRYHQQQELAQQRMQREQQDKERSEKEESAFRNMDTYYLEYARQLQLANIPFRVSAGNGTVLLVKPSNTVAATGDTSVVTPSSSQSSSKAAASKPARSNMPPPFAQPGIQRLRQAQADQRKRKITTSGTTHRYVPSEEVLSMSPGKFASKLESTLKQRLMEDERAKQQCSSIATSEFHPMTVAGDGGILPGSSDHLIHAQNLAHHRQKLIINQNKSVIQQVRQQKAAINKKNSAQLQQQQQRKNVPSEGESNYSMLISGSLPLEWSDNSEGINSYISLGQNSVTANSSSSSDSLFSRIVKGHGSSSGIKGTSISNSNNDASIAEDSRSAVAQERISASHNSAALEVSMSGYEDEDAQSRSSHIRSAALTAIGSGTDEVGAAQEFGCEFSFL